MLPEDLTFVIACVEAAYPSEGCGVLIHTAGGHWRTVPMQNVYDRYHAKDPERFPRNSQTAYMFDPLAMMRVFEQVDAAGDRLACIFHSHVDVGAYFSAEDIEMAAPGGEPLFPGVSYLVVAVDGGKASSAQLFAWNDAAFHGSPVRLFAHIS